MNDRKEPARRRKEAGEVSIFDSRRDRLSLLLSPSVSA
jgi:hypothetical protein